MSDEKNIRLRGKTFTIYTVKCHFFIKCLHQPKSIDFASVSRMFLLVPVFSYFCCFYFLLLNITSVIVMLYRILQWYSVLPRSWIYNYLCNQCISPLTLWVQIALRRGVFDTTLCDKVCQWLAAGRWFSLGTPVSSIN